MGRPRWRRSLNQLGTANTAPDAGPVPALLHARTQACFERPARLCHQRSPNCCAAGACCCVSSCSPSHASRCLPAPPVALSGRPHVTLLCHCHCRCLAPPPARAVLLRRVCVCSASASQVVAAALHEWGRRRRPWGGQGRRSFYFQTLPSASACCPRRRLPNHHTHTPSPTPAASSCPVLSCQIIAIILAPSPSVRTRRLPASGLAKHAHLSRTPRDQDCFLLTLLPCTHTRLPGLPACLLPAVMGRGCPLPPCRSAKSFKMGSRDPTVLPLLSWPL